MKQEPQLLHLSRSEKKRLVKGWHTSNDSAPESERVTSAGSLRSLFAPPPEALEYETQRTGTWRSTADSSSSDYEGFQDQQQDEKLPKTVSQVKLAYRTRARNQEVRDATNAIRKREKILELRRGPNWREELSKRKAKTQQPIPKPLQEEEEEEDKEAAISPQNKVNKDLQLLNQPVDKVVTNATYRDEILRQIRHQLAQGRQVLLQSDCFSSTECVSATRLMLQTLCTQSLAYCTRDQEIVPTSLSNPQSTRLTLQLLPRHSIQM